MESAPPSRDRVQSRKYRFLPEDRSEDSTARDAMAAHWVTQQDAQSLTGKERQDFEAWLAQDVRNFGAYVRAQAFFRHLNYRASPSLSHVPARNTPSRPPRTATVSRRRFLPLAAASIGSLMLYDTARDQTVRLERGHELPRNYAWHQGVITLDALTTAYLPEATSSDRIEMINGRLGIQLHSGIVSVSTDTLRLTGTAADFDLTRSPQGLRLQHYAGTLTWQTPDGQHQLTTPTSVEFTQAGRSLQATCRPLSPDDIIEQTAWRQGTLVLNDTTLQNALARFAPYTRLKLMIRDPHLSGSRISGSFALAAPEDFALSIARLIRCRVEISNRSIAFTA
mgnify:CR=1 FL=1